MPITVTAIFDIGKTNKKFFLFDHDFQVVHRESIQISEVKDEDGFPTEDLNALVIWIKEVISRMLDIEKYQIKHFNFATYGASLVHIDDEGKVLTPLYNYLKPIDQVIISNFFQTYGPEEDLSRVTGSPNSGMLNSGMQLFWLKQTLPIIFKRIKYSLHLPQYLSYVFTGIPVSEYTSIGCHTALWDYSKEDYHAWVYREEMDKVLAPIVVAKTNYPTQFNGREIKIGVGLHDSSSSLIPYLKSFSEPFILLSTGTWSVSLNPFSKEFLTDEDVLAGGINYMTVDGKAVRASRLLLGKEYTHQLGILKEKYGVADNSLESFEFNRDIFDRISKKHERRFNWKFLPDTNLSGRSDFSSYSYDEAIHQLIMELVQEQIKNIEVARGGMTSIKRVLVDGGFNNNNVFMSTLALMISDCEIVSADASVGSALGAAMILSDSE